MSGPTRTERVTYLIFDLLGFLLNAWVLVWAWNEVAVPRGLVSLDFIAGLLLVLAGHCLIPTSLSRAARFTVYGK